MMYGWNSSPTKAQETTRLNNADGTHRATVYNVAGYDVVVAVDGGVTYAYRAHSTSDPIQTFPNMEIRDGEMRLPITDIVGEILKRIDPCDLAQALWTESETAREKFMDALAFRWSREGVDDGDRRKFIDKVKNAVHEKALDRLADKMALLEYAISKRSYFYHEVNQVNEYLRNANCRNSDGTLIQLTHEDNDPDFRINGKHWNGARAFWRDEVLRQFPIPADPTPDAPPSSAEVL